MIDFDGSPQAARMLEDGRSDEFVERLTGLSLLDIVELRAIAAAAPAPTSCRVRPDPSATSVAVRIALGDVRLTAPGLLSRRRFVQFGQRPSISQPSTRQAAMTGPVVPTLS